MSDRKPFTSASVARTDSLSDFQSQSIREIDADEIYQLTRRTSRVSSIALPPWYELPH